MTQNGIIRTLICMTIGGVMLPLHAPIWKTSKPLSQPVELPVSPSGNVGRMRPSHTSTKPARPATQRPMKKTAYSRLLREQARDAEIAGDVRYAKLLKKRIQEAEREAALAGPPRASELPSALANYSRVGLRKARRWFRGKKPAPTPAEPQIMPTRRVLRTPEAPTPPEQHRPQVIPWRAHDFERAQATGVTVARDVPVINPRTGEIEMRRIPAKPTPPEKPEFSLPAIDRADVQRDFDKLLLKHHLDANKALAEFEQSAAGDVELIDVARDVAKKAFAHPFVKEKTGVLSRP